MSRPALLAAALLAALAGCPPGPTPVPPPVAPLDAGTDAGPAEPDAGPPGADAGLPGPDAGTPYALRVWAEQADAGLVELGLDGGLTGPLPLEPTARLALELRPRPADVRVRLVDGAEQALESDDAALPLDGGWRYQVQLAEPLKAGKAYTLVVDAEQGASLLDPLGRPLDDVRLTLQVRGEPAGAEAGPGRAKKKRR